MTGARKLARDYIHPLITSPQTKVLDVCCGDRWVQREMPTCDYIGLDQIEGCNLKQYDPRDWIASRKDFVADLILSIYGLQHLLSEEARVWTLLRRIAKPTTKFVYVGRYLKFPGVEISRPDPLNGYNREAFSGLALASGWEVKEFKVALYEGDSYKIIQPVFCEDPNAFAATLEPLP